MANRTLQAVRQAVYAALTSPPLTYQINAGPTLTLPAASIQNRPIWSAVASGTEPPSPYVTFTVGGRGNIGRFTDERILDLKIVVSSTTSDDDVTEIYEAIRGRLHLADQNGTDDGLAPPDLSRVAVAGVTLGVNVRECIEGRVLPAEFEKASGRWYLSATYAIVAN
ncbi:MAG: hypothetical protein ACYCUI_07115 [Vulcanimicrobiaceae bacterium]